MLGRRQRRHPSLGAFALNAGPTETRQRAGTPFARGLRRLRRPNGDKTGRDTLRLIRHRTKTRGEAIPPGGLVQRGGPCEIQSIVTGHAWPLRVTGLIYKGVPVITVCNPALWEYSGDNLGV
jgi:hypothetical protein